MFGIATFIGICLLLKTNNPLKRWNVFTINPKWSGKLTQSVSENPSQLFKFDKPSKEELIKHNRDKNIDKLLN